MHSDLGMLISSHGPSVRLRRHPSWPMPSRLIPLFCQSTQPNQERCSLRRRSPGALRVPFQYTLSWGDCLAVRITNIKHAQIFSQILLSRAQTNFVGFFPGTFKLTEVKVKTIGEHALAHSQLSPSHDTEKRNGNNEKCYQNSKMKLMKRYLIYQSTKINFKQF